MSDYLCIEVTFLDPRFHGRGDGGEPEWPPSPLRLMQAMVAANTEMIGGGSELNNALEWLEGQAPPLIVAPPFEVGEPYCLSVPNNAMDIVGKAWAKGNYSGSGDSNPATHRAMKTIRPVRLIQGGTIHYLWKLNDSVRDDSLPIKPLIAAAKRIVALGWGVDLVMGNANRVAASQVQSMPGERWFPVESTNAAALRTPVPGTLNALRERYQAFLHRIGPTDFTPVEPLTRFAISGYRRAVDPISQPYATFELRHDDGSFCQYPQRKLAHIAGMVRHLAKIAMLQSPPLDVDDDWVERYIVGHRSLGDDDHRQLSYLPLPTIGHKHADHALRRIMIAAPVGDDAWLGHLAQRLAGMQLEPENGDEFGDQKPPTLVRVYRDSIARRYANTASRWASVTPIILPGHDDRKSTKTNKLISRALAESGIEQPCQFEWSPVSTFRKALSAYKYKKDPSTNQKRWQFENVKEYLRGKTWVHLMLTFNDEIAVSGPIVIGAGRHCGFGLMAAVES